MAITTIPIRKETRDLLRQFGSKGKTYDQIIHELIEIRQAFISDLYRILEEEEFTPLEEIAHGYGIKLKKPKIPRSR